MRTLLTTPAMEGADKDVSKYDIELKNVTFGYNQDDVIKDVSFSIPAGSVTALVGPSGSGKSTISKLIARFWDVRKGQISIGGMDVRTIEPEHLMRCMSFVFQDVTLFNDTVFNNIRVGNMNATEEQVMAAAKAAYCDEFIQRLGCVNCFRREMFHETSCVRGGLPGNHPCSPKEKRYGALRRCGPAHGGVKAQRVPCSGYLAGRRLSYDGRRSLSPSDRCGPRGSRKNLRASLLLYRAAYHHRR